AYNDGAAGEGDNVLTDTEKVIGGEKDDTLSGDSFANWLYGGNGNDTLSGLGGNDTLDGPARTDSADGGAATDATASETGANCANGPQGVTLTAAPPSVSAGAKVTVTWTNVTNPTTADWIGLYHPGDASSAMLASRFDSSCTTVPGMNSLSSGSCSFTMPLA